MTDTISVWGVLFRSDNLLDGYREHLIRDWKSNNTIGPVLFKTRKEARKWAAARYDYIKRSASLRVEPHGWKPVKVVRVNATYNHGEK